MIKPILFNTEMVRAILDGYKTVTRRAIKAFIPDNARFGYTAFTPKGCISARGYFDGRYGEKFYKLPYKVGDILYVRETWGEGYEDGTYIYKADDRLAGNPMFKLATKIIYHPSIHMPKEAARIWLRVTNVRVERLQDITPEQCIAEGVEREALKEIGGEFVREMFHDIWDSTIKKSDRGRYGWSASPWVWVIEFERCEKPEGWCTNA